LMFRFPIAQGDIRQQSLLSLYSTNENNKHQVEISKRHQLDKITDPVIFLENLELSLDR
jgi:hypothetical protein